jgi:molybdopterin molybdotransferase
MIPYDEALKIILAALPVEALRTETVPLAWALGRTLSAAISAKRDQPPFDASAMDGYACCHADLPGHVTVVGEAAAGHAFVGRVQRGTCVRISTGAPVPEGADCVIPQEAARRVAGGIDLPIAPMGHNVRRQGNDFTAGERLLQKGQKLDARDIALLAALGLAKVPIVCPPRVTIICVGDEIVTAGENPSATQIFDSAGPGVAACVVTWGGEIVDQKILRDDKTSMVSAIEAASTKSDLVVIIGGASAGPHDHARPSIEALGGEILVSQIAIKPGKPTWFARTNTGLILGLPGNPAAALVCARLFLAPILQSMLRQDFFLLPKRQSVRLASPLPPTKARAEAFRVSFDACTRSVKPFDDQDSSLVSVLSKSDGLVVRDANANSLQKGADVELILWDE